MKKIILSAIALATIAMAGAQTETKTEKNLVITDKEGKTMQYKASELEGVAFEPAPQYTDVNVQLLSAYEEKGPLGFYRVELGMTPPDENGDPVSVGDMQVALLLAGPWTDNLTSPVLPDGYYRIGNSTQEWTFDVSKSAVWIRVDEGSEGVTPLVIIDGSVDVRKNGDKLYDIRMEFETMSGPVNLRYQGELPFSAGMGEYEAFTEDLNLNFTHAQGRFYGNWYYPFSADLTAEFISGTIEGNEFKDGYVLELSMFEPKPADYMAAEPRIADGTYNVETREAISNNANLPYTFTAGRNIDFMGEEIMMRTCLTYTAPDGHRKAGLITGGTITVSGNGTNFVFDFVTDNGISVKGTYTGTPYIGNYCDNDSKEPKRPYSSITTDVDLSWTEGTEAFCYNEDNNILADANTLLFLVGVPELDRGQYLQFSVLSEDEVIADGTYNLDWTPAVGSVIPGTVDFAGVPIFSWYGDLDRVDADGNQLDVACIASGKFTISSNTDGTKKIVFDLTDDGGKKITGEYNGKLTDITPAPEEASKIRKINERRAKSVRFSKAK